MFGCCFLPLSLVGWLLLSLMVLVVLVKGDSLLTKKSESPFVVLRDCLLAVDQYTSVPGCVGGFFFNPLLKLHLNPLTSPLHMSCRRK